MRFPRRATPLWLSLLIAPFGCSSGGPSADGGRDLALEMPDAADDHPPANDGDNDLTSGDLAPDLAPEGPVRSGVALPVGGPVPVRLFGGDAQLVTYDDRTCSHQLVPDSPDRWCALIKRGTTPGMADLWVMNVTMAAAGQAPLCDGSSPSCLLLTQKLATSAGAYFDGDTLLYYAEPVPLASGDFLGRIYAWRPGWTQGRLLTSDRGALCFGHTRSAAAGCLDDPAGNPANRDSVVLRVGFLTEPAAGPLPALAGKWALRNDNMSAWQTGFSPDGQTFAFSNADQPDGPVALKTVAIKDAAQATPAPVLNDLVRWTISNDSQKIYFNRGTPENVTLHVADFPTGAGEQMLATDVTTYSLFGDRPQDQALGLLQREPGGSAFLLFRDRTVVAPERLFLVPGNLEGFRISSDLRYTVWLDGDFRARVVRNADRSVCQINFLGELAVFSPDLLSNGGLVFWHQSAADDRHRRDGFLAAPDTCREATRFGWGIDFFTPVEGRGLIFGDEREDFAEAVTLKYAAVAPDGRSFADPGVVRIAEQVKTPVFRVGDSPLLLVYRTVDATGVTSGTYVFGPLPF